MNYRADIDGLRAVAILCVIAFHAFPGGLSGGFVGVDIFFVISGYLISGIILTQLHEQRFSYLTFYSRRARRIFPALIVVLAATYAVGWLVLLPTEFQQLSKHIASSAGFYQNFTLWKEVDYFDAAAELKPLLHIWSLSLEEQFYLIFPVFLSVAVRLRLNLLAGISVVTILSFWLNVAWIEADPSKTFFLLQTRCWELLAGAIVMYAQAFGLGSLFPLCLSPQSKNRLSGLGAVFILVSCLVLYRQEYPGWAAIWPVIGTCMLIGAGSDAWINKKLLSNRLMVSVGLISYPLYLWHWPILSFARIIESETPSVAIRVSALALSFLLAWMTYIIVEKPIRHANHTRLLSSVLYLLTAGIFAVGLRAFENPSARNQQLTKDHALFSWDLKLSGNDLCTKEYAELVFEGGFCVKSKPKPPTVMLLGDSHSNVLYPGLDAALTNPTDSLMNIAGAGCPPFFETSSVRKGGQDQCSQHMDKLLTFSATQPTIHTIVMASRGPLYLFGSGYNDPHRYAITLTNRPELHDTNRIFQMAMKKTIRYLLQHNKKVIFVIDVPELGFDPKSCIQWRPFQWSNHTRQPCAVARKEVDNRNRIYRQLLLDVLSEFPDVKVFDPTESLCDDEWCWAIKDGEVIYRDSDHLNLAGSLRLGPQLQALIQSDR